MRKVKSPNPDWKPGDELRHPFPTDEEIILDPSEVGPKALYPFIISSVVPRPIAFICSLSKEARLLLQDSALQRGRRLEVLDIQHGSIIACGACKPLSIVLCNTFQVGALYCK